MFTKIEIRIIPEDASRNLYIKHLKAYELFSGVVEGKNILDVGCGDGYGTAFLAKSAKSIIGVDYKNEVILSAQRKYKENNLEYVCMNSTNLGFKEGRFDAVCSFQVIEHIPEDGLLTYLSELKRVLKKDGELYLSTLNLDKMIKNPGTYEKSPAHCKEFKLDELRDLLAKVFNDFDIYGLHSTLKYSLYLALKRSGIFKSFPDTINPVSRFYRDISLHDFKVNKFNLKKALDFICICRK